MDPRRQGDFGERSALNWLIDQGASVYLPFGHSPDLDLVAFYGGRLVGIQVKSTTGFRNGRWVAALATRGRPYIEGGWPHRPYLDVSRNYQDLTRCRIAAGCPLDRAEARMLPSAGHSKIALAIVRCPNRQA